MKLLDEYFALQNKVHDYFGYVEDWVVIPLECARDYYWTLDGEGPGTIRYGNTERDLKKQSGDGYYEAEIYTQRFLPKWVYRGKEYTLIAMDPHVDGNKFLAVFDNDKERKL